MALEMSDSDIETFVNQKLEDVDCPCCGGFYLQDMGEPLWMPGRNSAPRWPDLPLSTRRPVEYDEDPEMSDTETDEDDNTEEGTC